MESSHDERNMFFRYPLLKDKTFEV